MTEDEYLDYWLVGASPAGSEDKTDALFDQGEWRFWPDPEKPDQYRDKILAMRPGDQIAIKASYVRKRDLPFENRGQPVSVMAIKAVGEITENPGDGRTVCVDWKKRFDPPREWYFYTSRLSVWKPDTRRWEAQALIGFVFDDEEQDIDRFRNEPFWRDRYGDADQTDSRFAWTGFYQAFADRLLDFEARRTELVQGLRSLQEGGQVPQLGYLFQKDENGVPRFIEDICPFTFMGAFNRSTTNENRRTVAAALARLIGLDRDVPETFEGVPVVNSQRSSFFAWATPHESDDIDRLWQVFRAALAYADAGDDDADARAALSAQYDAVILQKGVGWTLSIGLYWIRPWVFLPLDQSIRAYLNNHFGTPLLKHQQYKKLTGAEFLDLLDDVHVRMEESASPVASFPEISLAARNNKNAPDPPAAVIEELDTGGSAPYTLDSLMQEGCFFPRDELERMLLRLGQKKNLILQGAPGTGKTWLARRLANAWIGFRSGLHVIPLQFHPTLSYEDFVRGWRPSAGGMLDLVDGPFMQAITRAKAYPESRFVVVIEEINRGNPAQIFGEMLTLIEGDKRGAEYGMRLSHMREGEHEVHVPPNLYVVGTMNIADRSLALVDLALRRRFAFFDLEPQFNEAWLSWVVQHGWFKEAQVREIQTRMLALNRMIENDEALGPQFRVGHSYVTPRAGDEIPSDAQGWFRDIVDTDIRPLLEEYWFDRPDQAREQTARLLEGW